MGDVILGILFFWEEEGKWENEKGMGDVSGDGPKLSFQGGIWS